MKFIAETAIAALSAFLWVLLFFWLVGKYGPSYPAYLPWVLWFVSFEADLIKFKVDPNWDKKKGK